MTGTLKGLASTTMIFFVCASAFFRLRMSSVERYHLQNILQFGRDAFGRDCFQLMFAVAAESLLRLIPLALICFLVAALTGYALSRPNSKSMFITKATLDALSALPGFLIALALSAFLPGSSTALFFASLLMVFPHVARLVEAKVIFVRKTDFVLASGALGATKLQTFQTHLLPEILRLFQVVFPQVLTRLLVIDTSLSYLGLGRTDARDTWGRLIYQGTDYLIEAPWILIIFSLPLCFTLLSLQVFSQTDDHARE